MTWSMLCKCDVGGCAHMVDATLWVGWDGWGGMITFFACGDMVDATHL